MLAHERFPADSIEGLTYNMTNLEWPIKNAKIYPYISKDYGDFKKLGWYYFLTNISFKKATFNKLGKFDEIFKCMDGKI